MGGSNSKDSHTGKERENKITKYVEQLEKSQPIAESQDETKDNDEIDMGKEASKANPENLRRAFVRTQSILDSVDMAALQVNPMEYDYPFENMVMEGGGNKGLAYVGAIKCLEELQMTSKIKRIGGASAGAITASLFALGYNSDEIFEFLSGDIEEVFLDHSCGYLSLIPNLVRTFGWNPGKKIYKWFGNAISAKTGNPDTTFYELYESTGVELCVVVTNLNLKTAQYCHVKTTPNMPVRDALRMTMCIPGVFSAIRYENHGITDVYVDGGVLANYPVNCFDGWFLSMDKKDSFLQQLKSLKDLPQLMNSSNRFEQTGPNKTLGFLLFADTEAEIMRFQLEKRIGVLLPKKPKYDTPLFKETETQKKNKLKAEKEHGKIVAAVDCFLNVLQKHNTYDQDVISKDELKKALEDEDFGQYHRELLFGKDVELEKAFEILDKDNNGQIAFFELLKFIEERGIRMQVRAQGYGRREVKSLGSFLHSIQDTLLTNLKFVTVTDEDINRTVGINTGHVGTSDYSLHPADREFVVERGYNATMSFLRYYAVKYPDQVKKGKSVVQDTQPTSIHDDLFKKEDDNESAHSESVCDKDILLNEKHTALS